MYDVAVIGGGPVGSQVAYRLASTGYKVVVLEKNKQPGGKACCTGIISKECADSFRIDDGLILKEASSASLFSPSGKQVRLWRKEPQACIVERKAFDAVIARRAQDKGVEYVLDSPVKDVEVMEDRVRVQVIRQEKESDFEARAAVIANGFGSSLTERLGLGKIGDFVVGAQAEVETKGVDEVEVYFGQGIAPGFFAWLVPTSSSKALVGLLSRRNPGLYLRKLMSSLLAEGKILSAEAEMSYGGVPIKPLPRTYGNRLLVVGDAAGQVKPTTGGGIYFGLLCADIAASSLQRALVKDDLSSRGLSGYQRLWKRKLDWELRTGYAARKFYERLSDRQIERIFEMVEFSGIVEYLLNADDLSFDWHGKILLRLFGHEALSKSIKAMMVPFRINGN